MVISKSHRRLLRRDAMVRSPVQHALNHMRRSQEKGRKVGKGKGFAEYR